MKKPLLSGIILTVCVVIVTFVFVQAYPLGIVSLWKLDEGDGTIASDSVDTNHGTIYGATWTTGIIGNALSFDGVDDYVDAGNDMSLQISNDITVSLWAKIPSSPRPQYFISKYDGNELSGWLIGINSGFSTTGEVRFCGRDVYGWCTSNFGPKIDDNQWHHIVGQREGSVWKIFVDGCLSSQNDVGTSGNIAATNINLNLGRDTSHPAYYTEGILDEVAIFNRALSAEEIAALASRECVVPPDNLVSWWDGDAVLGTTILDIKDGNDGTMVGGASIISGKVDNAFSFDGVDDYVLIGKPANLDITGEITIDAWIKPQNLLNGQVASIAGKWGYSIDLDSYILSLYNQDGVIKLASGIGDGSEADQGLLGGQIPYNKWSHVATTYNSSTGEHKIYLNGSVVASRSRPGGIHSTNLNVLIGAQEKYGTTLWRFFPGLIDEVEIFNRALPASEIQDIYSASCLGKCKVIEVDIDIKPGSDPNCFNIDGHGVIPVAILGSADFDVLDINFTTLNFEGMAVRVRGKRGPLCSIEDSNGDPFPDLVCHFEDNSGEWTGGDTTAKVTGELSDGKRFEGTDSICIVQ